jgi:hypothetical protein
MAFTDTGDLAVAEQGANQIQIIPRSQLDSTKTDAPGVRRAIPAGSPQGVAVDTCSGEIFFTDSNGNLIGVLAGQTRVVASGLVNPTEILIVRRRGMRCPNGITIFVVEEGGNRVLCIAPQVSPEPIVFLSNLNGPRDLAFLPQGNNFADDANQASISVSDRNSIQQAQVSKLYTTQTEPIVPAADPDRVSGKVTITISGSSKLVIKRPVAGITETISLTVNLTFAGTTIINGKFLPSDRVLFDIGGIVPDSFGSLSRTLSFSSVSTGGGLPGTGNFTFTGQRVLAAADRQKGVTVLMDFDFAALNALAGGGDARIRPLDSNAPALLLIVLTGADFKTVDAIGVGDNKPEGSDLGTAFLRSGGIIAGLVEDQQILSSESSYVVTIR